MTLRRLAILCALLVAASLNAGEAEIVKYRQSLMKAMGSYMSALSAITKGTVPFRGDLVMHAGAIKDIARQLPALFPAGTGPDKVNTDALPTVWTKMPAFTAASKELETASARMQQLAKTSDAKAITAQFAAMKQACASCHESFRMSDD
jgi:cytochrome c556